MSEKIQIASLAGQEDNSESSIKLEVLEYLDTLKSTKEDLFSGLENHGNVTPEDIENIKSWIYTTPLSLHSLESLNKMLDINTDISPKEIQESVKWHILLSRMKSEVIELEFMYKDPLHRIGLQELSSSIEISMQDPFEDDGERAELLETLDSYHEFYELYRIYFAERNNFSAEFISQIEGGSQQEDDEGWIYRILNGEGAIDMNAVGEFRELLEVERSRSKPQTDVISLPDYKQSEVIASLFLHPDFPGDSEAIHGSLSKDIDLQGKYISEQDYNEIIETTIKTIDQDNTLKNQVIHLLQQSLVPSSLKSARVLEKFYTAGVIDNNIALSILEGEKGFIRGTMKMNQFIDIFGLPSDLIEGMEVIVGEELNAEQEENFARMLKYFLRIESEGGYNVANYAGASSAQGYLQTLKKNAKYKVASTGKFAWWKPGIVRKPGRNWKGSPFDTRLRKLPSAVKKKFKGLSQQYALIGNPGSQSVKSLSVTEQILLNFGHIFDRDEVHFKKALNGNVQSVEHLYSKIHHTKVDNNTKNLMVVARKEIYKS